MQILKSEKKYSWPPPPLPNPGDAPAYSGVVGRERMGTAFPHKKLSGNDVPTRATLSDSFIIAIKLAIFHCYQVTPFHAPQTMSKLLDIRIGKVLAH